MNEAYPLKWWQKGVIYHIYPLSFMDNNGDGYGDLPGILSRLDYLQRLGISAIWLSPVYPSPMADMGYDISDYNGIHPIFGTMDDFDCLLAACHDRNLRLIMDFVPNHTSDRHPWFIESRSSRDNPKRDWYLWSDPAPNGGPPNNWLSVFGGSAWEFDNATGQYYYHAFMKQQPDVNWRNPRLQQAMLDVMRFWLDKGVDGFRVDVMWHIIKDELLRNNPPNPNYSMGHGEYEKLMPVFSTDQPEVHDIVAKMRQVIESYSPRVLIGEIYLPITQLVNYYGPEQNGAHLPINFLLVVEQWKPDVLFEGIDTYEASLPPGAWPNWVLGNHDKPRIAGRVGTEQARVAAMLLLTLRGTATIYYGDEIGMRNAAIPKNHLRDRSDQHRDPQRSPMQWNDKRNAGFTAGTPWLDIDTSHTEINVEKEETQPDSMLSLYKELLAVRRREPALYGGDYIPVGLQQDMFSYLRRDPATGKQFLIILNLRHNPGVFTIPAHFNLTGRVLFNTSLDRKGEQIAREIKVGPDEGILAEVSAQSAV